jgi:hypothetical protein
MSQTEAVSPAATTTAAVEDNKKDDVVQPVLNGHKEEQEKEAKEDKEENEETEEKEAPKSPEKTKRRKKAPKLTNTKKKGAKRKRQDAEEQEADDDIGEQPNKAPASTSKKPKTAATAVPLDEEEDMVARMEKEREEDDKDCVGKKADEKVKKEQVRHAYVQIKLLGASHHVCSPWRVLNPNDHQHQGWDFSKKDKFWETCARRLKDPDNAALSHMKEVDQGFVDTKNDMRRAIVTYLGDTLEIRFGIQQRGLRHWSHSARLDVAKAVREELDVVLGKHGAACSATLCVDVL